MKISSARQIEMPFADAANAAATFVSIEPNADVGELGTLEFQAPERTATSRLAGRMNAASTSTYELNELLRERQILLDRKFAGEITKQDENRLELVRWAIDRIEDAKYGFELDQLESLTETYEQLLTRLEKLGQQITRRAGEASERPRPYGRKV